MNRAWLLSQSKTCSRVVDHYGTLDDNVCAAGLQDVALVRSLMQQHVKLTGSDLARRLLADWETTRGSFLKVYPHEYRKALAAAEQEVSPATQPLQQC